MIADDPVGFGIGECLPARKLREFGIVPCGTIHATCPVFYPGFSSGYVPRGTIRRGVFHVEQRARRFAVLPRADAEIAGGSFESRRRARFEPDEPETEPGERGGHFVHRGASVAAAFLAFLADPNASAQGRAGGDDDGFGENVAVTLRPYAAANGADGGRRREG